MKRSEQMKNNLIKSPLNYVGGKYKLLPQILPLFPKEINTFVDLFTGGCNVGVNAKANRIICNDIEGKVIELMEYFSSNEPVYILSEIDTLIHKYNLTETSKYGYGYYGCDSSSGVAKVNKEGYLKLRSDYNKGDNNPLMFYTMLVFAFNNQIRFNDKGEFNMPVNKRDFNDKIRSNLDLFVNQMHKMDIKFTNKDFQELKIDRLDCDDFVYCDPPYLITIAAYNERGGWNEEKEKNLLVKLDDVNNKGIKFALSNVLEHKGKTNEILTEWSKKYIIHELAKSYKNSNYQTNKRDEKESREVLITNY
jgi:DNA adenine methylase